MLRQILQRRKAAMSKYEQLNKIYDTLYARAKEISAQYNPCDMDENKICIRNRADALLGKKNVGYGCCGDIMDMDTPHKCQYLVPGVGCSTECLLCAAMYCKVAEANLPDEVREELAMMARDAFDLGLLGFREPKGVTLLNLVHNA